MVTAETLGRFLVVSAPRDCGPYFREVSHLIRAVENKIIWRKYHGNEKVGEAGQERREGKRQEDQGRKEHVDDGVEVRHQIVVVEGQ
jgi:hypothetical protein